MFDFMLSIMFSSQLSYAVEVNIIEFSEGIAGSNFGDRLQFELDSGGELLRCVLCVNVRSLLTNKLKRSMLFNSTENQFLLRSV